MAGGGSIPNTAPSMASHTRSVGVGAAPNRTNGSAARYPGVTVSSTSAAATLGGTNSLPPRAPHRARDTATPSGNGLDHFAGFRL